MHVLRGALGQPGQPQLLMLFGFQNDIMETDEGGRMMVRVVIKQQPTDPSYESS